MEKRKIIFGTYNTAEHGWTLTGWKFSDPEHKKLYIEKTAGDGAWDYSTALSDGIVRYNSRSLVATFECSEGTRLEREATIRQMINQLDGQRVEIELPDDAEHYIVGRLEVAREYSNLAHAAVSVSAVCEPWRYAKEETIYTLTPTSSKNTAVLTNNGRRAIVPEIKLEGADASVLLEYRTSTKSINAGSWLWPALLLTPGEHPLTYSGSGTLTITYREAVLE